MPINQPARITEHNRALALFADRLGERRLFLRYLHAEPPLERMLFFHGDGGNGKSLLLKCLMEGYCLRLSASDWTRLDRGDDDQAFIAAYDSLAASAGTAVPCVYHDVAARPTDAGDPQGYWSGPLMIRRALQPTGLKLPLFDYALLLYLRYGGRLSDERIKALFPAAEADFVSHLLDVISDTPVAGLAVKVLRLFDKHLKSNVALWRTRLKLDEERLRNIKEMAESGRAAPLGDALPRLLGESIHVAMGLPEAPPRLVLLIDAHEAFWGTNRHNESEASYFERDEWLRALLTQLYHPNQGIIVVMAGREPPRWTEASKFPIPPEMIDQRLIGHLRPPDADDYLVRALGHRVGATADSDFDDESDSDQALRTALIRATEIAPEKVHPLYLGLAADLCLQAAARHERLTAADFAEDAATQRDLGRTLFRRLLKYCNTEVQSAVTLLAAARSFDRELFFALGAYLHFDASRADFATFTGFSFVWPDPAHRGHYRIHDLLRRLVATLEPESTREAHAALETIYRERGSDTPETIAEAIYHANQQDWERGWREWGDVMLLAQRNARYALGDALAALKPVLRLETAHAAGNMVLQIGELACDRARYGPAQSALRQALFIFKEALNRAPDAVATYNSQGLALLGLGEVSAMLGDHAGAESFYTEAIASYDEALTRAPDNVSAHNNRGSPLVNRGSALLRLGELRDELDDYAEAEDAFTEAIATYDEALARAPEAVSAYDNKGIALARLGKLRVTLGDYAEAEDTCTEAIASFDEALTREPDNVYAHSNRGGAFSFLGGLRARLSDHASAKSFYTEAIAAYDEALKRAPDNAHTHSNRGGTLNSLGNLRVTLGDYAGAEHAYTDAIATCDEALTRAPDHVYAHINRGNAFVRLGNIRVTLGDYAEAEDTCTDAIASYDEALARAPDHVDARLGTAVALRMLANVQQRRGDHAAVCESLHKAQTMLERALDLAPSDLQVAVEHFRIAKLLLRHQCSQS
ncbi:MAG: tetratricopeptide repeat protein [Pseudomonadota bacterium]